LTAAFWGGVGITTAIASIAAAIYHRWHPRTADLFCPVCEKQFSSHWDEVEAAFVYHDEFDCREE
jgi:hypothetical protein